MLIIDFSFALVSVAIILLFPTDAFAWGPVAHLDFSSQILAGAAALSPALSRLLLRRPIDFLYGSLAADATIGKNLAKEGFHCHSWAVAKELLRLASKRGEHLEAFMFGYLSHLGADVVAHNHFIPDRLVAHYRAKGIGHLYWEARFDQRLLSENPELSATWQELSQARFPEHDRFLAEHLKPTLFSHRISASLYHRSLGMQRHSSWQDTMAEIDTRSKMPLRKKEIERWRIVSVALAALALNDPSSAELAQYDPTGRVALSQALGHRRMLRRQLRRRRSSAPPNIILDRRRSAFASTYPPPSYIAEQVV